MRNKKRIMPRLAKLPELGTKAAALEGCVDLIARMCGKPETVVRYWLDLYFQVRLAFAVEEDQRRRKEDGCWRTQWLGKVTAAETAHDTAENAAPAPEARADEESAAETKEAQEPVAEQSATPPPTGELTIDISPVRESSGELAGFQPFTRKKQGAPVGNTRASDAWLFKRETFERLTRMRKSGITINQIVSASRGNLTDDVVLNILQAGKMSISYYRKLAAALDRIES